MCPIEMAQWDRRKVQQVLEARLAGPPGGVGLLDVGDVVGDTFPECAAGAMQARRRLVGAETSQRSRSVPSSAAIRGTCRGTGRGCRDRCFRRDLTLTIVGFRTFAGVPFALIG